MASDPSNLFITFVDAENELLKVWGQAGRTAASFIEKQMHNLTRFYQNSSGPSLDEIQRGKFCFARYEDGTFYRARIMSDIQGNSAQGYTVKVLFIDYGNKDNIDVANIRIPDDSSKNVLATMSEQAQEFYLAGVMCPVGGWSKDLIMEIRRELCYEELKCHVILQLGDQKILQIRSVVADERTNTTIEQDYSHTLVLKNWARELPLSVQKQLILQYCNLVSDKRKPPSPEMIQPQSYNHSIPHMQEQNYSNSYSQLQERLPVHGKLLPRMVAGADSPKAPPGLANIHNPPPIKQMNQTLLQSATSCPVPQNYNQPIINETPSFHSNTLNPMYNQYNNSVQSPQVAQTAPPAVNQTAQQLMSPNLLNNPALLQALALQVKQHMTDDSPKQEDVPRTYINPELLVNSAYNVFISFIDDGPWSFSVTLESESSLVDELSDNLEREKLRGIKRPILLGQPCVGRSVEYGALCRGVVTHLSHNTIKLFFVDYGNSEDLLVQDVFELPVKYFKTKILSQKFALTGLDKVKPTEDIKKYFRESVTDQRLLLRVVSLENNSLPSCELFLKHRNIKEILNERVRQQRGFISEEFPRVGSTEKVIGTWVENPKLFYVQLQKKDDDLKALKDDLAQNAANGKPIAEDNLRAGMACVCLYDSDQQWYRAKVSTISEDSVTVFYVDFGNRETVHLSKLRFLEGGLMSKMRTQAIRCALDGFNKETYPQELSDALYDSIADKEITMQVVSAEKDHVVVKLFANNVDIGESMCPKRPVKEPVARVLYQSTPSVPAEDDWRTPPSGGLASASNWDSPSVISNLDSTATSNWDTPKTPAKQDNREKSDRFGDRPNRFGGRDDKSRSFPRKENDKQGVQQRLYQVRNDHRKTRFDSNQHNWREDKREFKSNDDRNRRFEGGGFGGRKNDNDGFGEKKNDWGKSEDINGGRKKFGDGEGKFGQKKNDWGIDKFATDDNFGGRKKFGGDKDDWGKSNDNGFGDRKKTFGDDVGRKRFDDSRPFRTPVRRDDVAPPGSTFYRESIDSGSSHDAIVTYYVNPSEFYVQSLNEQERFKEMMTEIQTYYVQKFWCKELPQENDIVIAKFNVDRVLYRAEVVSTCPLKVRYVDYGNEESVDAKGVYPVDKKFLDLPRQAFKCALEGVKPVGDEWVPGPADKFFEAEEFKCTFISSAEDVYTVSLEVKADGKDIANELVAAGHALSVTSGKNAEIQPADTRPTVIRPVDYSLLPGQVLRLYVPFVESKFRFFVQIDDVAAQAIQHEVNSFVSAPKNLVPLDKHSVVVGALCISSPEDNVWYRSKILETTETGALVAYVDYGDSGEVTFDKIVSIPKKLSKYQLQATECCLHGDLSNTPEEGFKDYEDKWLLFSVHSVEDNRLFVTPYDDNGNKLELVKGISDALDQIEPISHLPIIHQKTAAVIGHFESPADIYVQLVSDTCPLFEFGNKLNEFYNSNGEAFDPKNGENISKLCIAKASDECWYRCRLMSCTDTQATVVFVDYGNSEEVPLDHIKKLDPSFYSQYLFTKKVTLNLDYEENNLDAINTKISELTSDQELIGYFIRTDEAILAELVVNEIKLSEAIVSDGIATKRGDLFDELMNANQEEEIEVAKMETGSTVYVSHINSPSEFWVQLGSEFENLDQLQHKLQAASASMTDKETVAVGDVAAALYMDDSLWYRAKVAAVSGNIATVQFIDYGNHSEIDITTSPLKTLSAELAKVPPYSTICCLVGNWNEDATGRLEAIVSAAEEDSIKVVVKEKSDPIVVDLLLKERSIIAILSDEGYGSSTEASIGSQSSPSSPDSVYIVHINSPDDFYVHKHAVKDTLDAISNRLTEAETLEDVTEFKENEMYVFKFSDDGAWYRGRVLRSTDEGTEVVFVDYGNTSLVSEGKKLPDDLQMPPLAQNMSLLCGKNDTWSEAACQKLQDFADSATVFRIEVIVNGPEKQIVKMFTKDCNCINNELEALSEPDGRIEVYVSHVNSPTDFYVQKCDCEVDSVSEKLQGADAFEDLVERIPGVRCAVKFVDDESWYRAELLQSINDDEWEVRFIDYGNVSAASEFKKLPAELEGEALAKNCALDLKVSNIPESIKEEFINLAAAGEEVFRLSVIQPGDKDLVSLKVSGLKLEETLLLENINEEIRQEQGENTSDASLEDITDDDKNSKIAKDIVNKYMSSMSPPMRNETDEEKRVKIAITSTDGGSASKSDDEKVTPDAAVNVTDSELVGADEASDELQSEVAAGEATVEPVGVVEEPEATTDVVVLEEPAATTDFTVEEGKAETSTEADVADEKEIAGEEPDKVSVSDTNELEVSGEESTEIDAVDANGPDEADEKFEDALCIEGSTPLPEEDPDQIEFQEPLMADSSDPVSEESPVADSIRYSDDENGKIIVPVGPTEQVKYSDEEHSSISTGDTIRETSKDVDTETADDTEAESPDKRGSSFALNDNEERPFRNYQIPSEMSPLPTAEGNFSTLPRKKSTSTSNLAPAGISRGVSNEELRTGELNGQSRDKRLTRGIGRGVSLEVITSENSGVAPKRQSSCSLPGTPQLGRRDFASKEPTDGAKEINRGTSQEELRKLALPTCVEQTASKGQVTSGKGDLPEAIEDDVDH